MKTYCPACQTYAEDKVVFDYSRLREIARTEAQSGEALLLAYDRFANEVAEIALSHGLGDFARLAALVRLRFRMIYDLLEAQARTVEDDQLDDDAGERMDLEREIDNGRTL